MGLTTGAKGPASTLKPFGRQATSFRYHRKGSIIPEVSSQAAGFFELGFEARFRAWRTAAWFVVLAIGA
jgi:hypothetical protein